jgi:endogenous inhibitor of DNA gyrase (YacG/DUF329 family)
MKIQCSCGTKYSFEVTPEMARNPIRFVCQNCGLDSSEYINELVREELSKPAARQPLAEEAPVPAIASMPPPASRLKISHEEKPAEPSPPAASVSNFCAKHRTVPVAAKCTICGKPICQQCMEQFGYFCSPLCKNKADLQGVAAPVYAGQKFVVEAQFWRKAGLVFGSVVAVLVLAVGVWIWYAWFGAVPHPEFSVRFDDTERTHFGASRLVGNDQLIFLHGGILARYDLKTKKQIWSQTLVNQQQVADRVKSDDEETARENAKYGGDAGGAMPSGQHEKFVRDSLEGALKLRVSGENVWVGKYVLRTNTSDMFAPSDYQLTRYDWATGKVAQQVTVPEDAGEFIDHSNEIVLLNHTEVGAQFVTHVSLADGTKRTEEFHDPAAVTVAVAAGARGAGGGAGNLVAGGGQQSSAEKLAGEAQNLNLPGRIALPALIASESHRQQVAAELQDDDSGRPRPDKKLKQEAARFMLLPDPNGYIQVAVRMLEEHIVTREAMKAPPKKSLLDSGNVGTGNETTAVNEQLNEMQRNSGASTVSEDQSRYLVTLHRPDSTDTPDWTGEVIGPPEVFPLKTVNVLASGRSVIVFDKVNKKLWEASLTYPIAGGNRKFGDAEPQFGAGPCVENGDTLYVFDQAVLSAYDLTTGNARWRLPSIGIVGLFFDDHGMLYVNTTTGNPDDIKYARQIDVTKATEAVLLKLDPRTGKTLWSVKPGGFVSYLSGKFIYTVESNDPNPTDQVVLSDTLQGLQKPAYLRIARINPKDGHIMWDYSDPLPRAPFFIRFNDNSIELLFKKEVQVLHFLSF